MNEIIKITEKEGEQMIVSARDLHELVEMETRFDIWIKRMFKYGFVENIDYQCLIKNVQMPNGGVRQIIGDYALTLDCAKHISMMQKNDKGMQARKYFIEFEKTYKNKLVPNNLIEALQLALNQAIRIEEQQLLIEEAKPKIEFFDAVTDSKTAIDMGRVAKVLDMSIGRNKLFEFL